MKPNQIIFMIACMFIGTSCVDLYQEPNSFITEEEYIKHTQTIEIVNKAVDGLYYDMRYNNYGFNCRMMRINVGADDIVTSPKPNNSLLYIADLTPSTSANAADSKTIWGNFWKVITASNKIINGTPIPEDASKAKAYKQSIAEAYFMRALNYFYLVRIFGDVPIIKTSEEALKEQSRKPVANVYDEIIVPDLLEAIEHLPAVSRSKTSSTPSKWAAKACLTEVYMTMAGWPLKKGKAYYQKAADEALDIIHHSGLSLTPEYADLWKEALKNEANEHLFALHHSAKFKTASQYGKSFYARDFAPNAGWADYYANPAFMKNFPDDDRKAYCYRTSWATKKGTVSWENSQDKLPCISKYYDYNEGPEGKSAQSNGITPIYRYADVLLMYAEASNLATGKVNPDALKYLQAVQKRSHAPITETSESAAFDKAVFAERGWEFLAEYKRWFDLVRREKLAEVKPKQYDKSLFKANNHYYYPLPAADIEITKWPNNAGY